MNWRYYQYGIVPVTMPHETPSPSKDEIKTIFKQYKKALYLRYSRDFDGEEGQFWYVIKDRPFTLEKLPSKTRNMVRRCLKNCVVQKITAEEVINGRGYEIYLQEFNRYSEKGYQAPPKTKEKWAFGIRDSWSRGEDYWGVFCDEQLIAYGIVNYKEGVADLITWKCDYDNYKLQYPSYGLVYSMTEYYLQLEDSKYVLDGNRSFTEHSNVQGFLEDKFGYRKAYADLVIVYRNAFVKLAVAFLSLFEKQLKSPKYLAFIHMYKWSR